MDELGWIGCAVESQLDAAISELVSAELLKVLGSSPVLYQRPTKSEMESNSVYNSLYKRFCRNVIPTFEDVNHVLDVRSTIYKCVLLNKEATSMSQMRSWLQQKGMGSCVDAELELTVKKLIDEGLFEEVFERTGGGQGSQNRSFVRVSDDTIMMKLGIDSCMSESESASVDLYHAMNCVSGRDPKMFNDLFPLAD